MWGLVVGETLLLLLLLRALGALKLQNGRVQDSSPSYDIGGLKIGDIAPSFAAKDEHGHMMDLAESDEKFRILIFLKPGCSACSDAIALVNEYLERENHADVYIFGLADQDANASYAAQYFLRVPLWTPLTSSCEKMYDIRAVPFAFVLDETRAIKDKGVVSHPLQFERLLKLVPERMSSSS